MPLAASIELLHSATLVHDDVIDAAATRRGRATANALFDNAATVMVGDYMFAHAAELVARTGNIEVVRLFARTLMEMATGELHQDMSAYEYGQSTREYFNRIDGKTASLFATAAEGGAMVAGVCRTSSARRCGLTARTWAWRSRSSTTSSTSRRRGGAGQAGGQRPDARAR